MSDEPNGMSKEHPIMEGIMMLEDQPLVITLEGCSSKCLSELAFYEEHVTDEHKN